LRGVDWGYKNMAEPKEPQQTSREDGAGEMITSEQAKMSKYNRLAGLIAEQKRTHSAPEIEKIKQMAERTKKMAEEAKLTFDQITIDCAKQLEEAIAQNRHELRVPIWHREAINSRKDYDEYKVLLNKHFKENNIPITVSFGDDINTNEASLKW